MIRLQGIHLSFGGRKIFDNLNITISEGEKVALCGRNGTGKSTLFKLLTKELKADQGNIENQGNQSIGLLRQELPEEHHLSLIEDVQNSLPEIRQLQKIVEESERIIHDPHEDPKIIQEAIGRLQDAHTRLEYLEADKLEGKIERILLGLGFTTGDFQKRVVEFSGGWRMRIELSKLLLSRPDILLLDEPNNHLDIIALRWLEDFLRKYEGTVILISHDLMFLDRVGKRIIEIDRGKVYDFKGNYTAYKAYRQERKDMELREYESQQKVIRHKEMLIDKFRYKASKAAFAQSLITELGRMEVKEAPDDDVSDIRLRFRPTIQSGNKVVEIKEVSKSYGEKLVLRDVNLFLERGMKWSFIGANGNGKSTLVKLICTEIEPDSGVIELGHQVKIGYYAQEHSEFLNRDWTPLETLENNCNAEMRPMVRKILGGLGLRGEDVEKKISVLSGGEKARVRLALLLVQEHNFLILDEPTHHLDIPSKNRLKEALINYSGTVIIVSHDREFLKELAQKTILFEQKNIKVFEGDIDYYLEKTEQASVYDGLKVVEKAEVATSVTPDYQSRKKLQRQIQNLEKEILKLESELKQIEQTMHDPSFYEKPDHKTVLSRYNELQKSLNEISGEWEKLVEELD
ncbi:MAG: ABC-F family ATP-binding cassette domain-containing protein [Saprospiraceae bacterium]|nr:ABC-F family ATP-binding cassette domain-containing protein [Saprospiraceae bacterium]